MEVMMSTLDEWLNEPAIGLYSATFTLGSVIRFRGRSLVIRNHFHLMAVVEGWEPGKKKKKRKKSISMVSVLLGFLHNTK